MKWWCCIIMEIKMLQALTWYLDFVQLSIKLCRCCRSISTWLHTVFLLICMWLLCVAASFFRMLNKEGHICHLCVSHYGRLTMYSHTTDLQVACSVFVTARLCLLRAISHRSQWQSWHFLSKPCASLSLYRQTHTHTHFHTTEELIKQRAWVRAGLRERRVSVCVCVCGWVRQRARWERDRQVKSDSFNTANRGSASEEGVIERKCI